MMIVSGLPVVASDATSRQNDPRRMSSDHAVDLVRTREKSTRSVTAGSDPADRMDPFNDVLCDLDLRRVHNRQYCSTWRRFGHLSNGRENQFPARCGSGRVTPDECNEAAR
jgi:hypothetical protein